MIKKVISGGQTGADRAGLDAAIECGIPHGGWCPAGRKASDGRIPDRYALEETEESSYPERTKKNIENSDGTVIFFRDGRISPGCRLTVRLCYEGGKSFLPLVLDPRVDEDELDQAAVIDAWVVANGIEVLNVAGSRESKAPGIYGEVYDVICEVLKRQE